MAAVGYGEYRSIESNDTPEGRARNRRVTVVILPLEVPAGGGPP
jgi:chemotaxis protein MotB